MKILFLDDDPDRHTRVAAALAKHTLTPVCKATEAFKALQGDKFDIVFLDHDLGDFEVPETTFAGYGRVSLSGADVAIAVADLPKEKHPDLVVIHSANPDGAKSIASLLNSRAPSIPVILAPIITDSFVLILQRLDQNP